MNSVLTQILAVGLTVSQLFSQPIEQFRTEFNPKTDQEQVAQLLTKGCALVTKEFGTEKIDLESLLQLMMQNLKAANEKAAAEAKEQAAEQAAAPVTSSELDQQNSAVTGKSATQSIFERLDLAGLLSVYKQFCKGDKSASFQLTPVIEYYNTVMKDLPDHRKLKGMRLPEASVILDREGRRYSEIYQDDNRRKWIPLSEIPEYLRKAFVAAEDKHFYQHKGVDLNGIVRAFSSTVQSKSRPSGGSTITQQVVKNLILGDHLTFERKMREMVIAARVEKLLSKDEILELYLNYVFLGRSSWGVEMAARSYFGKSVRDLNYAESAFLAGMTRGPNYYDPEKYPDRALERRQYVLFRTKQDGYLPAANFEPSAKEELKFITFESPRTRSAFYFLNEIQREAKKVNNGQTLTSGAYTVRSTIHPALQKTAEQALQQGLIDYETESGRQNFTGPVGNLSAEMQKYSATWQEMLPKARSSLWDLQWPLAVVIEVPGTRSGKKTSSAWKVGLGDGRTLSLLGVTGTASRRLKKYDLIHVEVIEGKKSAAARLKIPPQVQGAVVVIENATGRILAMSGGFSYAASQLNRVTQSARQPGSTLKPFIYLSALDKGFQPNTLIPDTPVYLQPFERGAQPWSPRNYDGGSRGLVTMRTAVEKSLNLPTARMMVQLGEKTPTEGLDYIRGITRELGIYEKPLRVYPFVLGAQPARLLDMATAYATIANDGLRPTPHFIDEMTQNERLVYRYPRYNLQPLPTVDRVSFYQLRRILQGTLERGTAVKMKDLAGYVAGKTGTSNDFNDAWFIGFTSKITVAAWVGYDDRKIRSSLGSGFTGGRIALPIAEKVIRDSFNVFGKDPLPPPPSEIRSQIVEYPINLRTGQFGGDFREVFRVESGRSPMNTWKSALRGEELSMDFTDPSAEGDDNYDQGILNPNEDMQPQYRDTRDYYNPGAEDPYDRWRNQPRQVDPFLSHNPFNF